MTCTSSEFRKILASVSVPFHPSQSRELSRLHLLPMRGFVMGMIPMFVLLCQRILVVLGLIFLPLSQVLLMVCCLLIVRRFIFATPGGDSAVIFARPVTRKQDQISAFLRLYSNYKHPIWCLDSHWSTIFPLLLFLHPPKKLLRQKFVAHDGATLGLDWFVPDETDIKGICILLPGLNGTSQGGYTVDFMDRMGKAGFVSAVVNGRGAGRSDLDAIEYAFHLGRSADLMDVLEAVEKIRKSYSGELPIYIVGFSAGGIRATKFAAVYGENLSGRVAGIVSFGGAVRNHHTINLKTSTHVYQPVIAFTFAGVLYSKLSSLKPAPSWLDIDTLFTSRHFETFRDFDRRVTAVIHNTTLEEYEQSVFAYHDERWRDISVPTMIVSAVDDPVLHIDDAVIPEMAMGNSNIFFLKTKQGGHLGWPTGLSAEAHGYRWMSDVTHSFITALSSL
jgi:predicted alpha/beta-fold hydrolase